MNAPTTAAALAKPTLQLLAVSTLVPSSTHVQELRRARFDKKALEELAKNVAEVGILQHPLVRPLEGGKHEIVAGERRWLAAKQAGLKEIYVNVRELTDDQALEAQLSENLQREDLHELEEAEGYEELMKLKRITAEQVADMVGKSRSYVYARTKLLALCPEIRKAFYAGELDASTALLIARIPSAELQKRATKDLNEHRGYGEISNFREASEFIRDHFMLRLKEAPFDTNDEKLVPAAGSCAKCPKRTGNQRDLFGDVKDGDLCTDAKCFEGKQQAHFTVEVKALEAKGKKVIYGEAAKKLLPNWRGNSSFYVPSGAYVSLDEYDYGLNAKVGQALGKDFEPTLIQHPGTGKLHQAASKHAVEKARKDRGVKANTGGAYNYGAASARAKAKGPDVDEMLTDRLAELIHKKAPANFSRAWLLDLATEIYSQLNLRDEEAVAKAFGWPKSAFSGGSSYYTSRHKLPAQAAKLDERGLVLLMFQLVFACGQYTRAGVLKLFGIKEQDVRDEVIDARKEAAKKAREDAKAAKEAKKKRPVDKLKAAIEKREAKAKAKGKAKGKKK